jgi:hypothetical protein
MDAFPRVYKRPVLHSLSDAGSLGWLAICASGQSSPDQSNNCTAGPGPGTQNQCYAGSGPFGIMIIEQREPGGLFAPSDRGSGF